VIPDCPRQVASVLARRAGGAYRRVMQEDHDHAGHPAIAARLKRVPIHDHFGHRVTSGGGHDPGEITAMTKFL